jgi:hypothetical protein
MVVLTSPNGGRPIDGEVAAPSIFSNINMHTLLTPVDRGIRYACYSFKEEAMTTADINFEDALDLLIATTVTCLRNDNRKLRRAIEVAISYRELSPTSAPAISLQQLELLGDWLVPPKPTGRGH